jgi:hypothetical protein
LCFSWKKAIKLEDRYINHWKKLSFNDDNKNGGNKLQTYRKLKNNMNLNFWNSSISLNEGTTELILENNSLRHSSNLEHFKMKLFHPLVLYYREMIVQCLDFSTIIIIILLSYSTNNGL